MGSEKTAAAEGKMGEIRRDPFAMLPFCGYNMGDYWKHWLDMFGKIKQHPLFFRVNWFRKDKKGKFMWPGFGDNMRVIEWIIRRAYNKVGAKETVLGWMPNYKDMTWRGLTMTEKQFDDLMSVDKKLALQDVNAQGEYFEQFLNGNRLPSDMDAELVLLSDRLSR